MKSLNIYDTLMYRLEGSGVGIIPNPIEHIGAGREQDVSLRTAYGELRYSVHAAEMLANRPIEQLPFERRQGLFEADLLDFLKSYQKTSRTTKARMWSSTGKPDKTPEDVGVWICPSWYDNPGYWESKGESEAELVVQQRQTPYMKCGGGDDRITIFVSDRYPSTYDSEGNGILPILKLDPTARAHDLFSYKHAEAQMLGTTGEKMMGRNAIHEAAHWTWGALLTPYPKKYEDEPTPPPYTVWGLLDECISVFADGNGFRKKDPKSLNESITFLNDTLASFNAIKPGDKRDAGTTQRHGPRVFCEMLRRQFPAIHPRFDDGIVSINDDELNLIWTFVSGKWKAFKESDIEGDDESKQLRFLISIADELVKQTDPSIDVLV